MKLRTHRRRMIRHVIHSRRHSIYRLMGMTMRAFKNASWMLKPHVPSLTHPPVSGYTIWRPKPYITRATP